MVNRSFLYGDGLFETIRVSEGHALQLPAHFERLSKGLQILDMQGQTPFTYAQFSALIKGFIAQQATANLRIRSTFFRQLGGRYTPTQQTFEYVLEATPLTESAYPVSTKALTIGIAQQVRLAVDALSNLKTTSALPYVLAGIEKKKQGWDDCLLLNHEGHIAEAIAANIFLKIGNQLRTPALHQGCIAGVMRQQVLRLAPAMGYRVLEDIVTIEDLRQAEELWLTNALQGVVGVHRWVGREQNYRKIGAKRLQEHLSNALKNSPLE